MNGAAIDWYIEIIKKDLISKMNKDFTGNVEYRVNILNGGLVNINRCVKDGLQFNKDTV